MDDAQVTGGEVEDSVNVIGKCNCALLQSFLDYSKSFGLQNVYQLSSNLFGKSSLGIRRQN